MRKYGLIGYPLSHSFSPAYFQEKFTKENVRGCSYTAYPITSIDQLPELIERESVAGLNVTIPYKKHVIQYLDHLAPAVKETGACNCIKIVDGKLTGYNTDVVGFERALSTHLSSVHTNALILGTGGSAAAVSYVLRKLGIRYSFASRSRENGALSYQDLDKAIIQEHKLIINTTPLGMFPNVDRFPDIPYQYLSAHHYLFDLIYNPEETLFLKKGQVRGAIVKNGAEMLAIQAEESWRIWNS